MYAHTVDICEHVSHLWVYENATNEQEAADCYINQQPWVFFCDVIDVGDNLAKISGGRGKFTKKIRNTIRESLVRIGYRRVYYYHEGELVEIRI